MRFNYIFFFFNDTATTEIYTLSLHDALPICTSARTPAHYFEVQIDTKKNEPQILEKKQIHWDSHRGSAFRSEEHTSELQSLTNLVCRLLLEKKKKKTHHKQHTQTNRYTKTQV